MTDPADGRTPDVILETIPTDECYRLLRTQQVGRLGVNAEHYPLILPVNYGLDGTTMSSARLRAPS